METTPPPHQPDPTNQRPSRERDHVIGILNHGLPSPLDDTPEALLARNHAASAELAAMQPANAIEAAFAAQCVAARAQADNVMRLLREHDGDDLKIVMGLNAQYIALTKTSQAAHGRLLRAQAARYKRETSDAALKTDEWTQDIVARLMQDAPYAGPVAATPAVQPPPAAPAMASASQRASTLLAVSTPVAARALAPATPMPAAVHRASPRMATLANANDPPRDLLSEADYYAVVYPNRAREIRRHGGLPANCGFGPPDADLVRTLRTSNSPTLRALDDSSAATD
jgi:hypothetical protein